jgi:hypothetical protein
MRVPLVLLTFFASATAGWTEDCAGDRPRPHPYGNFDFNTNSRVEPYSAGASQFRYQIISCVHNNDSQYPVWVQWFIPQVRGFVPGNKLQQSTPRLSVDDPRSRPLESCIEYGNRPEYAKSPFWGLQDDSKTVHDEDNTGCRAVSIRGDQPRRMKLEDIFFKIKYWLPSNAKNPKSTMLLLDGSVGIKILDSSRYVSSFEYNLTRQEGSSGGEPSQISVKPLFQGPTEVLFVSFAKKNPEPLKLSEKGSITFEVTGIENPELQYASYGMFDQQNAFLGAVDFPVFVSSR